MFLLLIKMITLFGKFDWSKMPAISVEETSRISMEQYSCLVNISFKIINIILHFEAMVF